MLATYYSSTDTTYAALLVIAIAGFGLMLWGWWPEQWLPQAWRSACDKFDLVPAWLLREGDAVDLEGDPYADPSHDENDLMAFELFAVTEVEQETPQTVVVHFDNGSFGFPTNHKLRVRREP